MSRKDELIALAERVEALTGPDREVDVLVFQAIGAPAPFQFANKLIALEFNDIEQAYFARVGDDMQVRYSPPAYSASLDAAMSLVRKGWVSVRGWDYPNRASRAIFMDDEGVRLFWGRAATPALAMTAAALRAIAKIEGEQP
jgi:hypothetical protein